jgi:hypothetical protein
MTLKEFIDYLHDHDCELSRDIQNLVFQIRRRTDHKKSMTMPYRDKKSTILPVTICKICHDLEIPVPESAQHAKELFNQIIDHINGESKK